jgi:hypothetical protein
MSSDVAKIHKESLEQVAKKLKSSAVVSSLFHSGNKMTSCESWATSILQFFSLYLDTSCDRVVFE